MASIEDQTPERFGGFFVSAVDDKGRILIDKKNRDRLGRNFVASVMPNGCLALYRKSVWQKMEAKVERAESDQPGWEHYSRLKYLGTADELNCDQQGRFVIPQGLREMANLKEEGDLISAGNRLEIWNAEEFKKYRANPFEYNAEQRRLIDQARSMVLEQIEGSEWGI